MKRIVWAVLTVLLVFALAGCARSGSGPVTITQKTVVVDVRTPQEYADAHLKGALLLDLNGGQLVAELPTLDRDAEYLVYCRSGSRSAKAVTIMKDAGLGTVTDLGSMDRAAQATGLSVVR